VFALGIRQFLLEKADSCRSECEDAIAVSRSTLRFAVTDGATEGFNSRRWARALAVAWVRRDIEPLDLPGLQAGVQSLGERLQARYRRKTLPWYLEEKARQGSFAAFVGLSIQPSGDFDVLALGDCCLMHEGSGDFFSFPLTSPEDFTNQPMLVPSRLADYPECVAYLKQCHRTLCRGDRLLLMSDAIACWYLGHARGDRVTRDTFHDCLTTCDHTTLSQLIQSERSSKRLRNDDVAVLRLDVEPV
jgi:hypothetical protein